MTDRRRYKRLRRELRLRLDVLDSDASAVVALGSHMNPSGIFVRLDDPPIEGARVRITLDAEGTEGLLTAEGVVVVRVESAEGADYPPGVGVRLDDIGPAWEKLYRHLIA